MITRPFDDAPDRRRYASDLRGLHFPALLRIRPFWGQRGHHGGTDSGTNGDLTPVEAQRSAEVRAPTSARRHLAGRVIGARRSGLTRPCRSARRPAPGDTWGSMTTRTSRWPFTSRTHVWSTVTWPPQCAGRGTANRFWSRPGVIGGAHPRPFPGVGEPHIGCAQGPSRGRDKPPGRPASARKITN